MNKSTVKYIYIYIFYKKIHVKSKTDWNKEIINFINLTCLHVLQENTYSDGKIHIWD